MTRRRLGVDPDGSWSAERFAKDVARIERKRRALPREMTALDALIADQRERIAAYEAQGAEPAAALARASLAEKIEQRARLAKRSEAWAGRVERARRVVEGSAA